MGRKREKRHFKAEKRFFGAEIGGARLQIYCITMSYEYQNLPYDLPRGKKNGTASREKRRNFFICAPNHSGFFRNCSTHVTLQACEKKSRLSALVFAQSSAEVARAVKKTAIWVFLCFLYQGVGASTGRKRCAHHLRARNGSWRCVLLVVDVNKETILRRMLKSASFYAW